MKSRRDFVDAREIREEKESIEDGISISWKRRNFNRWSERFVVFRGSFPFEGKGEKSYKRNGIIFSFFFFLHAYVGSAGKPC